MISPIEFSIEVSQQYDFKKESLNEIEKNFWVKNQWPIVYFIQNEVERIAYVGESTNALGRFKTHLANPQKSKVLNKISIVGSGQFNKSATLDIESFLIQYISADGSYKLQNGNYGLVDHNYYQRPLYKELFKQVWDKLIDKKVVSKSIQEIENSEIFKYSPYKSLNEDQYNSVLEILEGLTTKSKNRIFIRGSAGTGKTILATYLIKLLCTDVNDENIEEYNEDELREINYIQAFQRQYPNAKIGLVVAMSSLRESLENVFKKIPGLKSSMVLNPADTFKINQKYDLLIVDETHRLRQYKNISWMGAFRKNNQKLGLDNTGNELDWILENSKNQIFFYDAEQSVKPSDIDEVHFAKLLNKPDTLKLELKSQMRVKGGTDYINFVDEVLNVRRVSTTPFYSENYDLLLFDSIRELYAALGKKEQTDGLCRLIAGFAWPWVSKKNKNAVDIRIDGMEFQWNQTDKDWINSANAFREIGCIHTTQGYDLNYAGIIFGNEISYDENNDEIVILSKNYFDINGKKGIKDPKQLKSYIINIYKTLMYRGIKGTYIYVCDEKLRKYLKEHIFSSTIETKASGGNNLVPFINSVPLYDLTAAAGGFSEFQDVTDYELIQIPESVKITKDHFACKVVGESMNKKIPNGSICLFKKDSGGSREGKIVLVEHSKINDSDFGAGYTVKSYHSEKLVTEEGWSHKRIFLKPVSYSRDYSDIILEADEASNLKVVGIFECVI